MGPRYFALILGIIYALVGLMGFVQGFLQPPTPGNPPVTLDLLHGDLLGIFPVNILHTLVHLLVGIWGILAYRSWEASRTFARAVAIIFGVLTIMGLIPGLQTTFGLIPLHSNDIWLHALTTALAAYFGWVAPADRGAAQSY
jgi:hypothetical protein